MPSPGFAPWLPAQMLGRLYAEHGDEGPALLPLRGAVLHADITGFTALTNRLVSRGPEGVEAVSRLLNRGFGAWVGVVYELGGEVVSFAGDALTAVWVDGDPEQQDTLARRCQARLQALAPHENDNDVTLHFGLSSGPLWVARLGGVSGRWVPLVGGAAIRLADAAHPPGRDPVSDALPAAVRPATAVPHDWLRAHLASVAWVRGGVAPVAELRPISTLFIRVLGLVEASRPPLARLSALVGQVQQELALWGGALDKMVCTGSGLMIHAAFGLPGHAHANDAERALECATHLHTGISALGLGCAIGVAAGTAFCGPVGSTRRAKYMLVGDTLNRAARLMQTTPSGVTCDPAVATAAGARFRFDTGGARTLKGFAQPIDVFMPVGRKPLLQRRLIGRETEARRFDAALTALKAGTPAALLIEGEAGMGKSVLMGELALRAEAAGLTVAWGRADPLERNASYRGWRGVFEALVLTSSDALEPGHRLAPLLPLLSAVLSTAPEPTPQVQALGPQARADATLELLLRVLVRASERRPLVVLLEDVHWLDSASWRLAEAASRHPTLLLVMASRPAADRSDALTSILARSGAAVMSIGPLNRASVERIVAERLDATSVDESLLARVWARTEGHPLYAGEYALLLSARGLVRRDGVRVALAAGAPHHDDAPDTVRGMIMSRIDALDPVESEMLKVASVLGRVFNTAALVAAHPAPASAKPGCDAGADGEHTRALLERLVAQQLLERRGVDFAFRHDLVREVGYGLMLFEQRKAIHEAVARWLLSTRAADIDTVCALVAHHFLHTDQHQAAVEWSDRAGRRALGSGAFREAQRFFESCLDLHTEADEPLRAAAWRRLLSDAFRGTGDVHRTGQEAEACLRLHGERIPSGRAGLTLRVLPRLLSFAVRTGSRRAVRLEPAARDLALELARAFTNLGEAAFFENQAERTVFAMARALEFAQRAGLSPELARASAAMGGAFGLVPLHGPAGRFFEVAQEAAEALEHAESVAYVHMLNALYRVGLGAWDGSQRSVERCQRAAAEIGDHVKWGNVQIMRFWGHHYRGEAEPAQKAGEVLLERALASGNRQHEAWALRCLAMYERLGGRPGNAIRHLLRSLDLIVAESRDLAELVPTWGALARAHLADGRPDDAEEAAITALGHMREIKRPTGHGTLEGYGATCEVLLSAFERDADRRALWRRRLAGAEAALRRYCGVFPIGAPRLWWLRAEIARLTDRGAAESKARATGLKHAHGLGMIGEVARLSPRPRGHGSV